MVASQEEPPDTPHGHTRRGLIFGILAGLGQALVPPTCGQRKPLGRSLCLYERRRQVSRTSLTVEQTLTVLAATPALIAEITEGLSRAQLVTPPAPGEWSARDVLAHLRACADMWGKYIVVILSEDHPTFKAVNPTTWIKKTDYLAQEFQPSLRAFARQRDDLLAVLEPLPRAGWSRSATVTGAGKVLELTVLFYAQRLARHERPHIKHIARIVSMVRM